MKVAFAGHSSVLIEFDGVRVVTDPLFRSNLLHLQRHAPHVDLKRWGRPDVLLISHAHLDHLDKRSLRLLDRSLRAVVPSDSVRLMRSIGFHDVVGLSAGDETEAAGLQIRAVHAEHGGKRMPWNPPAETIGFVVEGEQSVYYAGDTDIFDAMEGMVDALDLALLPVWGWGSKLGEGHLDPQRAAAAVSLLRPRVAVPVHWGGYLPAGMARRRPDLLTDPPRRFRDFVGRDREGVTRVEIIEPGSEIEIAGPER